MSAPDARAETRRLFVAVNLPAAVRAGIVTAVAPLVASVPRGVAWVREPNLHLTLRFLGDRPLALVEPLSSRLAVVAAAEPTFDLALGGLGAFPSLRKPRVLWIGVESNVALAALYQKVDEVCASLGVEREARPFHPHVTIGRVRPGGAMATAGLQQAVVALSTSRWSLSVSSVDLMSSTMGRGGSQYARLSAAPLAGAGGSGV